MWTLEQIQKVWESFKCGNKSFIGLSLILEFEVKIFEEISYGYFSPQIQKYMLRNRCCYFVLPHTDTCHHCHWLRCKLINYIPLWKRQDGEGRSGKKRQRALEALLCEDGGMSWPLRMCCCVWLLLLVWFGEMPLSLGLQGTLHRVLSSLLRGLGGGIQEGKVKEEQLPLHFTMDTSVVERKERNSFSPSLLHSPFFLGCFQGIFWELRCHSVHLPAANSKQLLIRDMPGLFCSRRSFVILLSFLGCQF